MLKMEMKVDWATWDKRMLKLQKFPEHVAVLSKQITEQGLVRLSALTPRSLKNARHLADRWQYKVGGTKTAAIITIYNTATSEQQQKVLGYLEKGTRAHAIEPKKKTWLKFEWLRRTIFAKHVEHPGTRAYKMVAITRDWMEKRFKVAGQAVLKHFSETWRQ